MSGIFLAILFGLVWGLFFSRNKKESLSREDLEEMLKGKSIEEEYFINQAEKKNKI